jgi:phosphate transport system ATP-binding protein
VSRPATSPGAGTEPGPATEPALATRHLSCHYGQVRALQDVTIDIRPCSITALIGPSGCGKSTFLRCFNRMNDMIDGARIEGTVLVKGVDIYRSDVNLESLRTRVGMVFQRSNPFPMSIRANVTFGPRMAGERDPARLEEIFERALRQADLWREVRERPEGSALELSGGQQQRLCIARALANSPEILLLDEPASGLDPIATARIEETLLELRQRYTIVIVTHNLQQAARISDRTAFLMNGELIEVGDTTTMFTSPARRLTEDYITGRFG